MARKLSYEEFARLLERYGIKPTYARWYLWQRASKAMVDLYNDVIAEIAWVLKQPEVETRAELEPMFRRQRPLIERYERYRSLLEQPAPRGWSLLNWVVLNPLDIDRVDRRTWRILDPRYVPDYDTVFTELIDYIRERLREKDELIKRKLVIFYRNMVVRNYTATKELPYPFLVEVRATYISPEPLEYITTDTGRRMRLLDALRITVRNMVRFFLPSIAHAEDKGAVRYVEHSLEITNLPEYLERVYVTAGTEKNRPISKGEARGFPLEYCIKYVRIVNEQSLRNRSWFIYLNNRIEEELRAKGLIVDSRGFVWLPERYLR